jgi:hypothetical protein
MGGDLNDRFHIRLWWGWGLGAEGRKNLPPWFPGSRHCFWWPVLIDAFRQELGKLGWIEGKNITIEFRFGENKGDCAPA